MRLHSRLAACVCLTGFWVLVLWELNGRLGDGVRGLVYGDGWVGLGGGWGWGIGNGTGNGTGSGNKELDKGGVRLVVLGDSGIDNIIQQGEDGRGRSWTEVLCEEIKCTTYLNFGSSQPSKSYPASPPTGAVTSNKIHLSSNSISNDSTPNRLPDLASQIQEFISQPPTKFNPPETIYIISFGTWDIYHLASLDYASSQILVKTLIDELFTQLDILYAHSTQSSPKSTNLPAISKTTTKNTHQQTPPFRIIIPKLLDPTFRPGWLTQRPRPLPPSSQAEEQKNAVYLTELWNAILENSIGEWLNKERKGDRELVLGEKKVQGMPATNGQLWREMAKHGDVEPPELKKVDEGLGKGDGKADAEGEGGGRLGKDVFWYDLKRWVVDVMLQCQLQDAGLVDASGLGSGVCLFKSVDRACVREGGKDGRGIGTKSDDTDMDVDSNGRLVCRDPKDYLFWNGFNLGKIANEAVGKEVGRMVKKGDSMRTIWKEGRPKAIDHWI